MRTVKENSEMLSVYRTMNIMFALLVLGLSAMSQSEIRPRVRDIGLKIGIVPTGALNAITDVPGVSVGHTTIMRTTWNTNRGTKVSSQTK